MKRKNRQVVGWEWRMEIHYLTQIPALFSVHVGEKGSLIRAGPFSVGHSLLRNSCPTENVIASHERTSTSLTLALNVCFLRQTPNKLIVHTMNPLAVNTKGKDGVKRQSFFSSLHNYIPGVFNAHFKPSNSLGRIDNSAACQAHNLLGFTMQVPITSG